MKHLSIVVVVSVVVALLACPAGAQEFEAFEGKEVIHEGEGGTKKVVDGIEFWRSGSPPRKFKLLGYISDRRHKTGLVGMLRMSGLEAEVAAKAREAGGDAVIVMEATAETVGTLGTSTTTSQANAQPSGRGAVATGRSWSTSASTQVQKQVSRFAVIKFIPLAKEEPKAVPLPSEVPAATPGDAAAPPAEPSAGSTQGK